MADFFQIQFNEPWPYRQDFDNQQKLPFNAQYD